MVNLLEHEIPLSRSFSWWLVLSPRIFPFLVLNSSITYEHNAKSSISISACNHQELTRSTAYIEYCICYILHLPNIDCLRLPASLSSSGGPCCIQFSTLPQLWVNQKIECQLPSCLPSELLPPHWPPPSTAQISLNHCLQVHLHTCLVTTSKCTSKLSQLWPPGLHDHGFSGVSPSSLDYGLRLHLQTCSITAWKCISILAWWWPRSLHYHGIPNDSANILNHCLRVYLEVCTMTASKCITNIAQSRLSSVFPNSIDSALGVHLYVHSIPG